MAVVHLSIPFGYREVKLMHRQLPFLISLLTDISDLSDRQFANTRASASSTISSGVGGSISVDR